MTTKTAETLPNTSFLDSVNQLFDAAVPFCELPEGMAERIQGCNALYSVSFGVRLRGGMTAVVPRSSSQSRSALLS